MSDGRRLGIFGELNGFRVNVLIIGILVVNEARAMRVAEIINDYRTLLVHISQQRVNPSQEEYWEEGFVVLRKSLDDAQVLMSANYEPCPVTGQGNVETQKAELQRYTQSISTRSIYPVLTDPSG